MSSWIKRVLRDIRSEFIKSIHSWWWVFYVSIFVLFILNAFHETYPDEFDNIMGGWYILHGRFIYSEFFTHHGPVPYFLAAFLELFSWQSFVRFRVVYALFLVAFNLFIYWFYKKQLGGKITRFYPFFIVLLGLQATYYWSHMLLADNVAAYALTAVYGLVILKKLYSITFDSKDLIFISVLSAVGLYSSLTFTYFYTIIFLATLFIYYSQEKINFKKILSKKTFYPILILLIPHIVWVVYLIITWSFKDYIYQNFVFNTKYYVYNYPKPDGALINPIRYAVIITHEFVNSFTTILTGLQNLNFAWPLNNMMAVANAALIIYMFLTRRIKMGIFILSLLIFANVRSYPLSKETDYQAAVYIFLSSLNLFIIIQILYEALNQPLNQARRIILSTLFLLVGTLGFFSIMFFVQKFGDRYYPKYMGTASLIYDRPEIAPIINKITDPNDIAWIGPFEFEELFYMNRELPSKYQILIPGMGKTQQIQDEMIAQYKKNPPTVIYFDPNFFILGSQTKSYSGFFINYLNDNYYTLLPYREGNTVYRSKIPVNEVDLETKLFIRKDKIHDVLSKLMKNGYVLSRQEAPAPTIPQTSFEAVKKK